MSYNGWSNRETWLVNLWFSPESRDDVEMARETLTEEYDSLSPVMKDFCGVDDVNWDELLSHFDEDEDEDEDDEHA